MKALFVAIITALLLIVAPWGTKEANDNCVFHEYQVTIWGIFGCHPDQFYSWRDR